MWRVAFKHTGALEQTAVLKKERWKGVKLYSLGDLVVASGSQKRT